MATAKQYESWIKNYDKTKLTRMWDRIKKGHKTKGWSAGMSFEYFILRAFELEGADVVYPYPVAFRETANLEQIDGALHIKNTEMEFDIIVESKDKSKNINIEPIAKMRNQLQRRPSGAIGALFSSRGFTEPAMILSHFLGPQTILLWNKDEIEYCFKEDKLMTGMKIKYRYAVQHGMSAFDITTIDF